MAGIRLEKRYVAVLVILAIVFSDFWFANLNNPVPSPQAISNVEQDPRFISLTSSAVVNGTRIQGSYLYVEFTSSPDRDFGCGSPLRMLADALNPFRESKSTTLVFTVSFIGPSATNSGTTVWKSALLLVDASPITGHIYSIRLLDTACASNASV